MSRLVFQEVKHDNSADSIVNILQTMKEEDPASISPLDYTVHSPEETPLNLVTPSNNGRGLKRVMVSASSIASAVNSSIISSTVGGGSGNLHDVAVTLPHHASYAIDSYASDPKRLKNVVVIHQNEDGTIEQHDDDQLIHQLAGMHGVNVGGYGNLTGTTIRTGSPSDGSPGPVSGMDIDSTMHQLSYLDSEPTSSPVSPQQMEIVSTNSAGGKTKTAGFMKSYPTKTVAGTVIPSSKTCNWVFENGQVCGKTFSKSYNLVVHMRMHEDIRPFACTLCDQTFRQKAHLQRHETTHGIHTKSFYRNPPAKGSGRRRKRGGGRMGGSRMDSAIKKKSDSEGEMMEDEEDDMYVPNGDNPSAKRVCPLKAAGRSYPSPECEDREADSDTGLYDSQGSMEQGKEFVGHDGVTSTTPNPSSALRGGGGGNSSLVNDLTHAGHLNQLNNDNKMKLQQVVPGSSGGNNSLVDVASSSHLVPVSGVLGGQQPGINVLVHPGHHQEDDDTSTVQDILHTVNSVPTLEQNIKYLQTTAPQTTNRRGKVHQISKLVDTTTISNLSLSNNNLPSLTATLSQHLPGSNILYTTLSGNATGTGNSKVVIENLDEHSPEIQAELVNALLADENYQGAGDYEEEVYRINTLPSNWWVSRKTRQGGLISEITYYSPQGLSFRSKEEIQNFMQNNIINRETRTAGLRNPPINPEYLPILDDTIQPTTLKISTLPPGAICSSQPGVGSYTTTTTSSALDANSIAQALIANLKPEPLESLQSVMAEANNAKPLQDISISSPANITHTLQASN